MRWMPERVEAMSRNFTAPTPRLTDHIRVVCVTCGRVPQLGLRQSGLDMAYEVTALCHGKTEVVTVDNRDGNEWIALVPRRWFLRSWAGYTIRPSPAPGRRM